MSCRAGRWAAGHNLHGSVRGPIASKLKVRFNELICPPHSGAFYSLHTAVAFEVFRWMMLTGDPYRTKDYPQSGVREFLGNHVGCVNCRGVDGFSDNWKQDLRARFLSALLDPDATGVVRQWRHDYKIQVGASRMIPVRYRKPMFSDGISSSNCELLLDRILKDAPGCRLKKQLNKYHADANHVQAVILVPSLYYKKWVFVMHYGAKNDCSSWAQTITIQGNDELFTDFLLRTALKLQDVYIDNRTWKTHIRDVCGDVSFDELRKVTGGAS